MSEQNIPAHRHQMHVRSAEPVSIPGGNDDRAAKTKKPRAQKVGKPKAAAPKPAAAVVPAPPAAD